MSYIGKVSAIAATFFMGTSLAYGALNCQVISNQDLSIPDDITGYVASAPVDVSSKFGYPSGSILVEATLANTASGIFRVSEDDHTSFKMSGTQPVYIKAIHSGALGAGLKDKIFTNDGATYTLISTLASGLISGENTTNGYNVENPTDSKIFSDDFIWMSDRRQDYINFGTTSTTLVPSVSMELCAPEYIIPGCGNGVVETGETCDDGNTEDGDGCSSVCHLESTTIDSCQMITSDDLGVPSDTTNYDTSDIDLSSKFNLPTGSILVKATGANTVSGQFRVSTDSHIVFDITGTEGVYIKAIHGGALGAGLKDKIFINSGSTYTLTSTLANGLGSGTNVNPGYYVENPTDSKIYDNDFVWVSDTKQNLLEFGTTSTNNPRVDLELCIDAIALCGNGRVETGETCDDGNTVDGDGCSSTCQTESTSPVCGNGVIETGETCDDGNTVDGDGCSSTCQTESTQSGTCEDISLGTVDGTFELDAAASSNSGTANSAIENGSSGWTQTNGSSDTWVGTVVSDNELAPGAPASPNGGVFAASYCDDLTSINLDETFGTTISNLTVGDTYTVSFYQVNLGIVSSDATNNPAHFDVQFGDTVQASPKEVYAGAGNQVWSKVEMTFTATATSQLLSFDPSVDDFTDDGTVENAYLGIDGITVQKCPVCGNGIVESGEECDDSNTVDGDGCSAACQVEPTADLVTVKTVDKANAAVGDTVTFIITVTNNGPADTTNIRLIDVPQGSLENPVFASTKGDYNQSNGSWIIDTLVSGESATFTMSGIVGDGSQGGTLTNKISYRALSDLIDPTTDGDILEASVEIAAAEPLPGTCSTAFDWSSSAWPDGQKVGTITLMSGLTANIDISTNSAGTFSAYGVNTPNIDGINGSSNLFGGIPDLGVIFDPDADTATSPVTVTLTFSEPVYNGSFLISGIDTSTVGDNHDRDDRVTVTSNTGTPALTVLNTTAPVVDVSGNVATTTFNDNDASLNDTKGTVRVNIPDGATTVTILYEEVDETVTDHSGRGIGVLGNLSACVNRTVPTVNITQIDTTDVSGVTPTTATTKDTTPAISGTCVSGDTVTVQIDGENIAPTTECVGGTFTITPNTPLSEGDYNVTATQTDPSTDVTSDPSPVDYIKIDTTPPSILTIETVDGQTGSPVETTDTTPEINGTCTPDDNGTVVVQIDGENIAPTARCLNNGTYSIVPTTPLTLGDHNVTATESDNAGNSKVTDVVVLTIQNVLPDYDVALAVSKTTFIDNAESFFVTIRISELSGGVNTGDVVYSINKNSNIALTFDNALTTNPYGQAVSNADFEWIETPSMYKLIYRGNSSIFPASGRLYVGVSGVFTPPSGAKGKFIFKVNLRTGSGDTNENNNEDSDAISYSSVN